MEAKSGVERMMVTDEEALHEMDKYNNEINVLTLESRYYFWLTQFVMLVISTSCIYFSAFL